MIMSSRSVSRVTRSQVGLLALLIDINNTIIEFNMFYQLHGQSNVCTGPSSALHLSEPGCSSLWSARSTARRIALSMVEMMHHTACEALIHACILDLVYVCMHACMRCLQTILQTCRTVPDRQLWTARSIQPVHG
jgi:hypothetical protein